jgi:uncharacterized protein DUF4157
VLTASLQRRCACGGTPGPDGECAACKQRRLQRQSHRAGPNVAPPIVHDVLRSSGRALDLGVRGEMEARLGHDFSRVRVHTDERAAESAHAVAARAYTVGSDLVFARGAYSPSSGDGRRLLAHELTHVVQQDGASRAGGDLAVEPASTRHEQEAEQVASGRSARIVSPSAWVTQHMPMGTHGHVPRVRTPAVAVQRAPDPYIKKISVHLAPKESAELTWDGTPPASAPGSDSFQVSTGKGYSDPVDDPGTCKRDCCSDANKQCAPPWNEPSNVGACCTYVGTGFWTGTPEAVHGGPNGWKYWTPIQPWYSKRGIALHTHPDVTGDPIGHGCVRMAEENAHRIYSYSRGSRTRVDIDGLAAPVLCDELGQCGGTTGAGSSKGATAEPTSESGAEQTRVAEAAVPVVEGLEGEMS